jgi:hypothetical protein
MDIMKQAITHMVRGLPAGLAYQKAKEGNIMAKQKSSSKSLLRAIPVGTKVRMVNCLEAKDPKYQHDWVTASEPWMASGSWLVLLEGFRGGFSLDKLDLADEA